MTALRFTADVAPLSVNRAYAPARWGKRHGFRLTPEGEAFKRCIGLAALTAAPRSPVEGPVRVHLAFYWPTEAGDVDGPIKLTLDALQGFAYENDRQVKDLHVTRLKDAAHPRVVIEVEPLAEAPSVVDSRTANVEAQTPRDFKRILGPKPLAKLNKRRLTPSVRRFAPGAVKTEGT